MKYKNYQKSHIKFLSDSTSLIIKANIYGDGDGCFVILLAKTK